VVTGHAADGGEVAAEVQDGAVGGDIHGQDRGEVPSAVVDDQLEGDGEVTAGGVEGGQPVTGRAVYLTAPCRWQAAP